MGSISSPSTGPRIFLPNASTDIADAAGSRVHFVAVGTPQLKTGGGADLTYVDAAFASLLPHVAPGGPLVGKSTVPVGTAARLAALVDPTGAMCAWNPEVLREGYAVKDTVTPDRLVYGIGAGQAASYRGLGRRQPALPCAGAATALRTSSAAGSGQRAASSGQRAAFATEEIVGRQQRRAAPTPIAARSPK